MPVKSFIPFYVLTCYIIAFTFAEERFAALNTTDREPRCQGLHEVYLKCAPTCPGDSCKDSTKHRYACPPKNLVRTNCKPACMCKTGFYRNEKGACVHYKQCPASSIRKSCGENEYLDRCPKKPCESDLCTLNYASQKELDCRTSLRCGIPKCVCEVNFKRNRTSGLCVPQSVCVSTTTTTTMLPKTLGGVNVLQVFASGMDKFTNRMFYELVQSKPGKSVVCSGLSMAIPLATLILGSSGKTQRELSVALGLLSEEMVRAAFPQNMEHIANIKNVTLKTANSLYAPKELIFREQFRKDVQTVFHADVSNLDFSQPAISARVINDWVEQKTNYMIEDLIQPDDVNNATRLVIVNAIYIRGMWKTKFDPAFTKERDFYFAKRKTKKVQMMFQDNFVKYGSNEQYQIIELPYAGSQLSMIILLPRDIEGLSSILQRMTDEKIFSQSIAMMSKVKVKISIPKFQIETSSMMKKVLEKVGIHRIFSEADTELDRVVADKDENLHVTSAIQKAYIEVNEEGTTAGVVTGLVASTRSISSALIRTFIANHPFAFYLRMNNFTVFSGSFYG